MRHLTVTVDGEGRDATWKEGVGVYLGGHDFGKGDTVEIEGTAHEVTDMRRMQMHGERSGKVKNVRSVKASSAL